MFFVSVLMPLVSSNLAGSSLPGGRKAGRKKEWMIRFLVKLPSLSLSPNFLSACGPSVRRSVGPHIQASSQATEGAGTQVHS